MRIERVLVTGSGGFIGSHLAGKCVELGYKVRAFVRYNSRANRGWLEHSQYNSDFEFIAGDIRDYDSVKRALDGCDTVFHLAALIGIPYSYTSPLAYLKTNVEGTYNVLEAARSLGTANVLVTSTSEVYGTAQRIPMDESHPLVAQSPYAATKIAADQLALSYFRCFDLPVKVVRPFNTYGPRQSARAVIPTVITQLVNGETTLKLGNTAPTRDLTFISDTVRGFLGIAGSDALFGEVTNIGMNHEISVGDLVTLIAKQAGTAVDMSTEDVRVRRNSSEVMRLVCDNSKLKAHTDWRPEYELARGISETIAWIRENPSAYKETSYQV